MASGETAVACGAAVCASAGERLTPERPADNKAMESGMGTEARLTAPGGVRMQKDVPR